MLCAGGHALSVLRDVVIRHAGVTNSGWLLHWVVTMLSVLCDILHCAAVTNSGVTVLLGAGVPRLLSFLLTPLR